jgi:hypothetical protein
LQSRSCSTPVRGFGEDREADVTLIRRSVSLFSQGNAVLQTVFEASVEPPRQNGCLLLTFIFRFWARKKSSSPIPFFLFAHIPLRGCSDPSVFLLALGRAITMNFSRWRIFFPLDELRRKQEMWRAWKKTYAPYRTDPSRLPER